MPIMMRIPFQILLLLFSSTAFTADQAETSEEPAASVESETSPDMEASEADVPDLSNNRPANRVDDIFVPSIQISEDLSVSFPVDI